MKNHSTLLQKLPALYEAQTLESLPRHLLKFLRQVISADAIAYNEVQPATGRAKIISDPPELVAPSQLLEAFAAHMGEHPLIVHQQTTLDFSARKISDFLSRADYHRLGIYNEVYRHLGAEDQFALNLDVTPDTIVALAMNRSRRNFTEGDRETLNLLRPHLLQVYRNAQTLSRLQAQTANALAMMDELPVGLLVLDRRGQIRFATAAARHCLAKYFHHRPTSRALPVPLRHWLQNSSQWLGQALPGATHPFSVRGAEGKLIVRVVREPGAEETKLLLEEFHSAASAKALNPLGLTPRESEILMWVARGKSNPEIATILAIAPRTVQKHLEHIFAKLGVESRTAAARRALEVFSPSLGEV